MREIENMSKVSEASSSIGTKESLQQQRPGLRQLRSTTAAQAFSGIRTKQTLAPSSNVTRRTKIQSDVPASTKNGTSKGSDTSTDKKGKCKTANHRISR